MDYKKIICELNEKLEDTAYVEDSAFSYETSGVVDSIQFYTDDVTINMWCSEDDECSNIYGNDGDYSEKFFVAFLTCKLDDIGDKFNLISKSMK